MKILSVFFNPYTIEIEKETSLPTPKEERPATITPSRTPHPAKDIGKAIVNIDNGTITNIPITLIDNPIERPMKSTLKTEKN